MMKPETVARRAAERVKRRENYVADLRNRMLEKARESDWWAEYYQDVYGCDPNTEDMRARCS